jgi:hypothetical protein
MVPDKPERGAVWVRGEWQWQGRRWGWKPGVWVLPPKGAVYAPWTITRNAIGQLYYASGSWHDADGGEIESPPPLQQAKARSGAVINLQGESEPTGQDVEHAGATDAGAATPPEPDAG